MLIFQKSIENSQKYIHFKFMNPFFLSIPRNHLWIMIMIIILVNFNISKKWFTMGATLDQRARRSVRFWCWQACQLLAKPHGPSNVHPAAPSRSTTSWIPAHRGWDMGNGLRPQWNHMGCWAILMPPATTQCPTVSSRSLPARSTTIA